MLEEAFIGSRAVIASLAFLLPGWLLNRRFASPFPLLTLLLAPALFWYQIVIIFTLANLPLQRLPLLCAWTSLCAALAWWAHRKPATPPSCFGDARVRPNGAVTWVWAVAAGIGLLAVLARAVVDPLSGWDNDFRWDHLARLMIARGSLAGYPPVTAAHFADYAWCDGFPPFVSCLNFWAYLVTGELHSVLTAPRVCGEAILTGALMFALARRRWAVPGAWAAVGMAATSAGLVWGLAHGQESGAMTVALLGMIWLVQEYQTSGRRDCLVWAGLAGGMGAVCREYGLAMPLLGLLLLGLGGRLRVAALTFLIPAALVAAPWYLRNWAITGNPIFPHEFGGLFPSNPVHVQIMKLHHLFGLDTLRDQWRGSLVALATIAGAVLSAGLVGGLGRPRQAAGPMAAAILFSALWLVSILSTAGGVLYSQRVLTPVFALAAVLSGWLGTKGGKSFRVVAALVGLGLAIDASLRSWALPVNPLVKPGVEAIHAWRYTRAYAAADVNSSVWPALAALSQDGKILVDHPHFHVRITEHEGHVVPIFSPLFAECLMPAGQPPAIVRDRLVAAGIRYVATDPVYYPLSAIFYDREPFLRDLVSSHSPNFVMGRLKVYDLRGLRPIQP